MSARTPSDASRPSRRSSDRGRPPVPVDRDRDAIVLDAVTTLGARFPDAPRDDVVRLAQGSYDAVVGPGVPLRSYLRDLVVHAARDLLDGETTRSDAPRTAASPDARPIVVGYDASPAAESALNRALLIGRGLAAPVRLVAAWQQPLTHGQLPLATRDPAAALRRVVDQAARRRFGSTIPAWFSSATVEGHPAQVLIAESRAAQMLVVGSRGHGGFVGLLLGSVSSACAEHAACPVLVMHAPLVEHEDPVSAGAEALGDGSRATDAPASPLVAALG
ncbi:nucleotide-binding universal stress UspA family protein [Clavibacter sp. B3I6]|uniref:universal stress protein n=1 Tax=Clavibacter sp. B3I6 TaxID=3042268 RepID=UPI0027842AC5|nr:universal stress protein [Clavibacter sp. B3I6]MDQ0743281.1 nucleotide-binding universal stress UspA family protein [Clavibacter sp. B3I6]